MNNIYFILLLFLPFLGSAQIITTIAGNGVEGYNGDGNNAKIGEFNQPLNVKFDNSGNMYIADAANNVIRKINSYGIINTIAGTGTAGYSGDGGPATNAKLRFPDDVIVDGENNIFIADGGNNVIRKINASGTITTIAGIYPGGSGGDGGPAVSAKLSDPVGLIFDKAGNLYFSDGGNARVRKINTTGVITTVAGNGVNGYGGDGGAATNAQISIPNYLGISSSGDIYIADHPNNNVRKVNSLGIISTIAGNGNPGHSGDGGPATNAAIGSPVAVVCDNEGNLYISGYQDCWIRKVNSDGIVSTITGNGTCSYGGDGGQATSAEIDQAICSAIDVSGNLYIADSKNNRIRRITYDATALNDVNQAQQNVTIYPNPAHDAVTIRASIGLSEVEVIIFNIIGQEIYRGPYSNAEIHISSYAAGIYFVKVGGVYAGRFVKE